MKWTTLGMVMLTAFGVSASHVFWESEFWRQPFLWTDRWHVLSFLAWQPMSAFVIYHFIPPGPYYVAWAAAAIWAALLWKLAKIIGRKPWEFNGTRALRWAWRRVRTWIS